LIAASTTVPKVEFVLRPGEQTDENRTYEEKDEHFDKEDLCEAGERFVHDIREAAGERAGRGGRIWGALVSTLAAVVQERGSLAVPVVGRPWIWGPWLAVRHGDGKS
jgi:hypothetical protein